MWIVISISALGFWPLGYWLSILLVAAFPGLESLAQSAPWPGWMEQLFVVMGIASGISALFAMFVGIMLPVVVIVLAIATYRRELRTVTGDFVWGSAGLSFIDDSYSRLIEEARREAFRLSLNPVNYGDSIELRLNHFAHYYQLYLRLSQAPQDVKLPNITECNCWADGSIACFGGCLNACIGLGALFSIPMLFRLLNSWPRIVAVKKTALRFFEGAFDAQIASIAAQTVKLA